MALVDPLCDFPHGVAQFDGSDDGELGFVDFERGFDLRDGGAVEAPARAALAALDGAHEGDLGVDDGLLVFVANAALAQDEGKVDGAGEGVDVVLDTDTGAHAGRGSTDGKHKVGLLAGVEAVLQADGAQECAGIGSAMAARAAFTHGAAPG